MLRLVDVALPLPLDELFTYHVPEGLVEAIEPGMRVVVPFKRDTATGVVIRDRETVDFRTRPIIDVPDPEPVFDEHMLALTRWVSEYYLSSWGEALRAALPHGIYQKSRWTVRPLDPAPDAAIAELGSRAPLQARLLRHVADRGEITLGQLRKVCGSAGFRPALRALEQSGHVEIVDESPEVSLSVRIEKTVRLDEHGRGNDKGLGPDQRRLLDALRGSSGEPVPLSLIRKAWGVSSDSVKRLERRELVVIEEREIYREPDTGPIEPEIDHELTPDQIRAIDTIGETTKAGRHGVALIHGVTGSGKTRVYLDAIERILPDGGAIVLVPEISLTPQATRLFKARFGDLVAVIHSRLSAGERFDAWRQLRSGARRVAVGPRSAVFAPVQNLRLIIVDEEHDGSYKQEEPDPRYNARDVAVMRGAQTDAVVVLGSATPSLESLMNARTGKYRLIELPTRVDSRPMPNVEVVDMTLERETKNFSSLSRTLRLAIGERLERNEQVVLLQNRRGFSPIVQCTSCGEVIQCRYCNVSMTYHQADSRLRCHYCGDALHVPETCPSCGSDQLRYGGAGTQKVQDEINRAFPDTPLIRMDQDTTRRKGAHHTLLEQFRTRHASILLGTQMVAKGLDFPDVTLVGVIAADIGLSMPDFRAGERTFQLLTQVSGRTGRGVQPGEVIVQTYQPDHPVILAAQNHDVALFAEAELREREELRYPPYGRLVLCMLRGTDEDLTIDAAEQVADMARKVAPESVEILGPSEAPIARIKRYYRWQVLLKGQSSAALHATAREIRTRYERLKRLRKVSLLINVDPMSLL